MNLEYLYIGLLRRSELGLIEISQEGTNYQRVEMGPGDWCLQHNEIMSNVTIIRFNTAIIEWGLITNFGIFDSLYKGNLLAIGNLIQRSITYIHKDIQIQFDIGKIVIEIRALGLEVDKNG